MDVAELEGTSAETKAAIVSERERGCNYGCVESFSDDIVANLFQFYLLQQIEIFVTL